MKIMCECCENIFNVDNQEFEHRINWRGEKLLCCEQCCVDIDEIKQQEEQLKNLEPVEDDEF